MLTLTTGKPASGMSYSQHGPAGENEGARSVAAPALSGRSVRASNLDLGGMHVVRAGVTVVDRAGFRWYVSRVRLGTWYGRKVTAFGTLGMETCFGLCRDVRVVALS